MGSILSLSLPAAPQTASKATQTEWNCPVCHRVQSNTEAVPCGHRFCLGCLLRHTAASPSCPLCASPLLSARFAVLGQNDFLQCILSPPGAPLGPAGRARRALFRLVYTRRGPSAPQAAPAPAEPAGAGPEALDDVPAERWAELLYGQEHLLEPVRPWLRQSLDAIYGPQWWEARQVESIALSTLCICGPDREALTYMLQSYLGEYTAALTRGLIHVTVHRCRHAWALRRCQAAQGEEEESPAASAGPSASPAGTAASSPAPQRGPDPAGDPPGAPEPARPGAPGRPPAAPAAAGHSQPQPVPEDAAPAPGPSVPRWGRSRQPRPTRRSQRRRAYKYRRPLRFRRRKPKRK